MSERLAIAQRIAASMPKRHGGDRKTDQEPPRRLLIDQGKTSDLVAAKAGFGSAETMQRATQVVESGSPELVEAMDAGLVSIRTIVRTSELPDNCPGVLRSLR